MRRRQVKPRIPRLQVKFQGANPSVQVWLQSAHGSLCLLPWRVANSKFANLRSHLCDQRFQGRLGINLKYAKSAACFQDKPLKFFLCLGVDRTALVGNNARKSQTRKQINGRRKCELRVITVVAKERVVKLNDWLLGLASAFMVLLLLARKHVGHQDRKGKCVSSCSRRSVSVGSAGAGSPLGRPRTAGQ